MPTTGAIAERAPRRHQLDAPLKQIAAEVRLFRRVGDAMGEGVLANLAWEIALLAGPIAERTAHAVNASLVLAEPQVAQDIAQRRVRNPGAPIQAREDEAPGVDRRHALEDGDRGVGERYGVSFFLLHAHRRDGPALAIPINLFPARPARLPRPGGGEHDQLDASLGDAVTLAHLGDEAGDLGPGQGGMVLDLAQLALGAVERVEVAPPGGRVVAFAQALGLGCVENALDAAAQSRGGLGLLLPNRVEDSADGVAIDLVHAQAVQAVAVSHAALADAADPQRVAPLLSVDGVLPLIFPPLHERPAIL